MPAILVECGFMDNFFEAHLLRTYQYRQECAREIAKGICKYYKMSYITEKSEKVDRLRSFLHELRGLIKKYE
jgi:N-acetylmuramoyl-L-alanine amidase